MSMPEVETALLALENLRAALTTLGLKDADRLRDVLPQVAALPRQVEMALAARVGAVHPPLSSEIPLRSVVHKGLSLNKHRKSFMVDFLVLSALEKGKKDLVVVDQILAHVAKVFPDVEEKGRASLITKISRLRRDKGCIVEDDELKGVGYRISEGGLKYLRDLETTYLTKDEKAYIKARLA